ncbi:uncharacterized protein LOC116116703 [Pistacia vera]|uniref:uncharacterized protein LOC116109599 n=1 Tax=Pistacia vera TaxID=55513 RepID=UPI001263AFEF|nr:uncharacterized protein LOC116109599 [Pistacia vera]XP_031258617.1 uncharacterized protein LOC116116703 [Pistacia vera]
MGTKIEYAINPLAASTNTNSFDFNAHHRVDDWDYFQSREVKKFQRTREDGFRNSMDRMLEKHNIDSIKRTMQIHEDIFKHQVQELHRLYSVQKMMMAELKKEIKQSRISSASMAGSEMNHSHIFMKTQNATTTSGYIFQVQNIPEDPSSRERSGSSQIGNKMSIEGSDEESEVELTLSIGVSSNKKRSKGQELMKETREIDSTASFKSDSGPNTPMSSSSATFDNQEKKMPHWLFGLSINRS